jgi:hypothetical protein
LRSARGSANWRGCERTAPPFANLFYTKAAFDYLLAYHMYEALKPGWYQRTNEAMKRQQGRTMIGYKGPGSKIPFVPPQLTAPFSQ